MHDYVRDLSKGHYICTCFVYVFVALGLVVRANLISVSLFPCSQTTTWNGDRHTVREGEREREGGRERERGGEADESLKAKETRYKHIEYH